MIYVMRDWMLRRHLDYSPSAWPIVASPFWFMLFFLRCFFLSDTGEAEPTSLVDEELDTPSTAESADRTPGCYIKSYIKAWFEVMIHAACIQLFLSPTLWAWLDSVEGHRCTPLLLLRNSAPPSPSISSTCRRLLALTGTAGMMEACT